MSNQNISYNQKITDRKNKNTTGIIYYTEYNIYEIKLSEKEQDDLLDEKIKVKDIKE